MALHLDDAAPAVFVARKRETRAPLPSPTHLVLIPSFNTGEKLVETVTEARRFWQPVWVVVDGSSDGSEQALLSRFERDGDVRVLSRARNGGKGAAIGAGVGGGVGAGSEIITKGDQVKGPSETLLDFTLQQDVSIPARRS